MKLFINQNSRRLPRAAVWLLLFSILMTILLNSGCNGGDKTAVGEENYNASLALISYEMIDDDFDGIIYREVLSFSKLMAEADVPLLIVFYEPMSELSTLFIPLLEEMAIEFDGRIEIILADIEKQSELADSFSVETLPQFSIVDEAVLKRSLIGFDDEAALKLRELVESYIDT
ncbi:MAG: hypothetical protein PWP10_2856 [Clostridiales bacterium]|nr:hypothetical protein [Clostridiales bacterium]